MGGVGCSSDGMLRYSVAQTLSLASTELASVRPSSENDHAIAHRVVLPYSYIAVMFGDQQFAVPRPQRCSQLRLTAGDATRPIGSGEGGGGGG
eukprot:COSAG03_NODE_20486_length_318_cov_1.168950_1_plen_92_part_01